MVKIFIILSAVTTMALAFCGDHELHGKLTESAIQVSNWLREYSRDDVTRLELHVASSMIAALRLAGHLHHTIISDFKSNDSFTIVDYLKSHLDNHVAHYKNLSMIKPGHIAYIYQAVSALCHDTENFYGRNLTQALHEGFSSMKQDHLRRQNYFEYSVVALAVCQSFGRQIQSKLASNILVEIKKHSSTETCSRIPDTAAMEVMALSCLRRNIENTKVELLQDIDAVIQQHLRKIGDRLRKHEDGLWNAQSKGLLVQAFMSLPDQPSHRKMHCQRLLKGILDKYDASKAFGNVLANIQILPALLGRSLVHLSNISCPCPDSQETKQTKAVCVKVVNTDPTKTFTTPDKVDLVVPEKATAYEILVEAAKADNMYQFKALETSYGRMITTIGDLEQDHSSGYYWLLYENEATKAKDGVDLFVPRNNTCIKFKYENCSSDNKASKKDNSMKASKKDGSLGV